MDEAAQWVLHAAQLPQEVADVFVNNMVTGYDFPELAARQVRRDQGRVGKVLAAKTRSGRCLWLIGGIAEHRVLWVGSAGGGVDWVGARSGGIRLVLCSRSLANGALHKGNGRSIDFMQKKRSVSATGYVGSTSG